MDPKLRAYGETLSNLGMKSVFHVILREGDDYSIRYNNRQLAAFTIDIISPTPVVLQRLCSDCSRSFFPSYSPMEPLYCLANLFAVHRQTMLT